MSVLSLSINQIFLRASCRKWALAYSICLQISLFKVFFWYLYYETALDFLDLFVDVSFSVLQWALLFYGSKSLVLQWAYFFMMHIILIWIACTAYFL